jgi:hypothetical protein
MSAIATALRFLLMGAAGFLTNMVLAKWMKYMDIRYLVTLGMVITLISPVSADLMPAEDPNFWRYIQPTSIMVGISICYICIADIMIESVPTNVESLCGGLVSTAFQIGSGTSLALAAAVVNTADIKRGHGSVAIPDWLVLLCRIGSTRAPCLVGRRERSAQES